MLGDKLGEEHGRIVGMRVLSVDEGPHMETSFQAQGRLLGVETNDVGTYVGTMRPDGSIYGVGRGFAMGAGGESASWQANGVGVMHEDGKITFRGALSYSTASEAWSKLNTISCVYEYEQDAEGNTSAVLWEWS